MIQYLVPIRHLCLIDTLIALINSRSSPHDFTVNTIINNLDNDVESQLKVYVKFSL